MTSATAIMVDGHGLITGLPVSVALVPAPVGSGISFVLGETVIPASASYAVDTRRGITLGKDGKTLSIVEHFLSACAMTGHVDLRVTVNGAPELPVLDGSAKDWVEILQSRLPKLDTDKLPRLVLENPIVYQDPQNPQIQLLALPSAVTQLSYLVNFPHPALENRWYSWRADSGNLLEDVAPARTFGMMAELPVLQAQGLAKGVTLENTVGLLDDGEYSTPLRFSDEPVRHKILDLIGDLLLCGVPVQQLQAHVIVYWGGHTAHLTFGQQLARAFQS